MRVASTWTWCWTCLTFKRVSHYVQVKRFDNSRELVFDLNQRLVKTWPIFEPFIKSAVYYYHIEQVVTSVSSDHDSDVTHSVNKISRSGTELTLDRRFAWRRRKRERGRKTLKGVRALGKDASRPCMRTSCTTNSPRPGWIRRAYSTWTRDSMFKQQWSHCSVAGS